MLLPSGIFHTSFQFRFGKALKYALNWAKNHSHSQHLASLLLQAENTAGPAAQSTRPNMVEAWPWAGKRCCVCTSPGILSQSQMECVCCLHVSFQSLVLERKALENRYQWRRSRAVTGNSPQEQYRCVCFGSAQGPLCELGWVSLVFCFFSLFVKRL